MLCIRYDALMSWPFDKMQWHLPLSIVRALPLCNTKWPEEWYSETMWASCTPTTLPQWCSTLLMILAQISYHSGSQKCWFSYFTHSFCMLAGVPLWSVHKQLPLFSSLLSITTHSWIFFFQCYHPLLSVFLMTGPSVKDAPLSSVLCPLLQTPSFDDVLPCFPAQPCRVTLSLPRLRSGTSHFSKAPRVSGTKI